MTFHFIWNWNRSHRVCGYNAEWEWFKEHEVNGSPGWWTMCIANTLIKLNWVIVCVWGRAKWVDVRCRPKNSIALCFMFLWQKNKQTNISGNSFGCIFNALLNSWHCDCGNDLFVWAKAQRLGTVSELWIYSNGIFCWYIIRMIFLTLCFISRERQRYHKEVSHVNVFLQTKCPNEKRCSLFFSD